MEEEDAEAWRRIGWGDLGELEEACRCAICGDFFDTPVTMAECGHTFCSLCVRRNIEYQQRSNSALVDTASCPQVRRCAGGKGVELALLLLSIAHSVLDIAVPRTGDDAIDKIATES